MSIASIGCGAPDSSHRSDQALDISTVGIGHLGGTSAVEMTCSAVALQAAGRGVDAHVLVPPPPSRLMELALAVIFAAMMAMTAMASAASSAMPMTVSVV